jgi:DNA-binding NarL/FixJ family response regulator
MDSAAEGGIASGDELAGRDRELAAVARLLAGGRKGLTALLLEGEAGMGKTTVFREALRIAEADGFLVLACRPSEAEASMSMAAVGDLLEHVPAPYFEALPPPQRHALDVVLLRAAPGARRADRRAVAAGVRTLIAELAAERPVLMAVDDVHWLDPASAAVLAFVLRRLGPERAAVFATRRPAETARLDLAAVVPEAALVREELGPLSLGALQRVLRGRLGSTLPRSTLVRVEKVTRGNPLYALEIGRALVERERISAAEPLPVPEDLLKLVRRRIEALPASTRDLLLAAALLAHPARGGLVKALAGPLEAALEPAEQEGLACLEGDVVTFAHPLYATAVIASTTAAEQRRMHLRLADAVETPDDRARHLGLGAEPPDASIADVLEEGAAAAWARGGPDSAAELLEWAQAFTPSDEAETRRTRGIRAAELHLHAGDRARSRELLEGLLADSLSPAQRTEALRLLAELAFSEEDLVESERLLVEAVAIGADSHDTLPAQLDLIFVTSTQRMEFARASELGREALVRLDKTEDGGLLAEALAYSAMADFLAGHGVDEAKIARALTLADPERIALAGLPADAAAGLLVLYAGRHAEARELLTAVRTRLGEHGYEGDLAHVLFWLSWLETRCANFVVAEQLADEAAAYAVLTEDRSLHRWATAQRAYVEAHRGEIDSARRRAAAAVVTEGRGVAQVALWITAANTLAELSVGAAQAAWDSCRPLVEAVEQAGIGEPVIPFFLPDALEALIALGELDRADALLDMFEGRGRELDRVWALATGARCRGLLLAARSELSDALEVLEEALREHERIELPFERARTLLARGQIARRARRRKLASESFAEASAEFERLESPRWAERSRAELERLGRGRESGGLTPSEQRVVELAADGLSNKEIASRLVVSVHTVEVHLSHAFAKLGVRSRSQLAGRL